MFTSIEQAILGILYNDEILAKTLRNIYSEVNSTVQFDPKKIKITVGRLTRKGLIRKFTKSSDRTKVNYYVKTGK